jgi:GNAT superfamily N-acetyltransferase
MFKIRMATVGDANILGELLVRSARFAYAEIASPEYLAALDVNVRATEYEARLGAQHDGHHAIFVAQDDDVALGFAELDMDRTETIKSLGVLQQMFFVPESFGRGLGPLLHEAVIEEFSRWGCAEAELSYVRGNDRARSFYVKNGWTETGELRPFNDHGRALFDIVMRRPIPSRHRGPESKADGRCPSAR